MRQRSTLQYLLVIILLGSFPLQSYVALAEEEIHADLIRVEITSPEQRRALLNQKVHVYARLSTPDGNEVLFLPASEPLPEKQIPMSSLRAIDIHDTSASLYLAWIMDAADLAALEQHTQVVEVFAQQAVIQASPQQVELLHETREMHLQPLELYPLVEYIYNSPVTPTLDTPDPFVQAFINQVNQSTALDYVRKLSGEIPVRIGSNNHLFSTRFTPNSDAAQKATRYVHDHFESLGLTTYYDYYNLDFRGIDYGERRNVVAEQRGTLYPEQVYLVTAHLDSRSETDNSSVYLAPGADDNASGTTAVLMAAEVLSQYSFAYTLRYVLFTGEEQWMEGSRPYAASLNARREQVMGVLNLDMIGYDSGGASEFELHIRPGEAGDFAIANTFSQVIDTYRLNLNPRIISDSLNFSDHEAFWRYDYPAALAMEDWGPNPHWHRTSDTTSTLDAGYFTHAIKAAVGTLAHLAQFYAPNLAGTITHSDLLAAVPGAQITISGLGVNQNTSSDEDGNYLIMIPGGTYTVNIQADGFASFEQTGVSIPDPLSGNQRDLDFDLCQLLAGVGWWADPIPPQPGVPVTISATYLAGSPPFTYNWEVDGTIIPTPGMPFLTHTFPNAGLHNITLTVSNACGTQQVNHPLPVGGTTYYLPLTTDLLP